MSYEQRKQQVLITYEDADLITKRALTSGAIEYLQQAEGATATRQTLSEWRKTTVDRSPFRHKYLEAYENAIQQELTPEAA